MILQLNIMLEEAIMVDTKIKLLSDFNMEGDVYICTDLHFGRKQFSRNKTTDTLTYLKQSIKDSNCKNILILGDLWDHRKMIDWSIFNEVNAFFEELQDSIEKIVILVGNHDCYYRNTIQENSLKYLHKMFSNIFVVQNTGFLKINKQNVLCVPWITSEDDKNNPTDKDIKKADIILGHFEFTNFEILPGIMASEGHSASRYKNKSVLSGHYHIASQSNGIRYLGVCQQMSWSDFKTKKGHYILRQDNSLEFVENTISEKYIKIFVNTKNKNPIKVEGFELDLYFDTYEELSKALSLLSYNIKLILEDSSNKMFVHNFIINFDMNQIPYVLIDNTPEHQMMFNIEEEQSNESISEMLVKLLDNSDQQLFKEIYSEALILDDA